MANNPQNAANQTRNTRSPFGAATVQKSQYEMSKLENRGGSSVAVLNVQVPLLTAGILVTGTIWARVPKNGQDAGKLVIEAGLPKNCSFDGDYDRQRFSAHALAAAEAYPGWRALKAKAISLLTGEHVKPVFDGKSRLVETLPAGTKRIVAETTTEATIPTAASQTATT
jgi:hypothetical protein